MNYSASPHHISGSVFPVPPGSCSRRSSRCSERGTGRDPPAWRLQTPWSTLSSTTAPSALSVEQFPHRARITVNNHKIIIITLEKAQFCKLQSVVASVPVARPGPAENAGTRIAPRIARVSFQEDRYPRKWCLGAKRLLFARRGAPYGSKWKRFRGFVERRTLDV